MCWSNIKFNMPITKIDMSMHKIYILSQLSLQTDFMVYAIENQINVNCSVFDQEVIKFPDALFKDSNFNPQNLNKAVVLIDREIHSFKSISREISNCPHCTSSKIALYNINEKSKIDRRVLSKQIRGMFYKDDHIETFIKGISAIIQNEVWISRETLLQYIFDETTSESHTIQTNNNLTKREIEILTLVSMGATNEEIAEKIFISTNTVKTHLYNIFKKIDVQNRIQAALWAAKKL